MMNLGLWIPSRRGAVRQGAFVVGPSVPSVARPSVTSPSVSIVPVPSVPRVAGPIPAWPPSSPLSPSLSPVRLLSRAHKQRTGPEFQRDTKFKHQIKFFNLI